MHSFCEKGVKGEGKRIKRGLLLSYEKGEDQAKGEGLASSFELMVVWYQGVVMCPTL